MKKINKIFLYAGVAMGTAALTGCIDETYPMGSTATEEQVQQSPAATEALVMGIPAKSISLWSEDWHSFFGIPAHMIVRDNLTGDYCQNGDGIGYGWHFAYWAQNKAMDENKLKTQFTWNYHYALLLSINQVVGAVDPANATDASWVTALRPWVTAPWYISTWPACMSSSPMRSSPPMPRERTSWASLYPG